MKLVDVKPGTYIDSSNEISNEDPKFKIGDIVRISKYKNIFAKGYVPNWSKNVFVIKEVWNIAPLVILNEKKLLERFTKKEFRVEKVIKRKGDKLYVELKG